MLYELRSYDIAPERWDEYVDWATKSAFPVLFDRFGFRLVGFWEALPAGDLGGDDTASASSVHWVLAWDSEEERHARWATLWASEDWKAAIASATDPATGERKFHRHRRVTLLRSWPISPLR
jgi:hypothetical protein